MIRLGRQSARYCDLAHLLGRSNSALSAIFGHALDHVYEKSKQLREVDWAKLDASFLEAMCALNRAKGSLLDDCVGFVDGTIRSICRPSRNQKLFHNGHRRVHSIKFQSI